jgi:phenylalanine-4-hydroxylase
VATPDLVQLDRDHPGFRDPIYRQRRNAIAQLALDHTIGAEAPRVAYSVEEEGVWRVALEHLLPLHQRFACEAHLRAWPLLGFSPTEIPQLADANRALGATGFRLQPVAGLVSPRTFMIHLADGIFLATQYVRHHSTPLYTPEPDVLHELIGHAALLADPDFARLNRRFGDATRAADERTIEQLIRVYWYALEFGLVHEGDGLRAIGAGLLSSYGELERFAGGAAELRPFSVAAAMATPFDPTNYQSVLFVGESSPKVLAEVDGWLATIVDG